MFRTILIAALFATPVVGQTPKPNVDEALVGTYTLPEVLVLADGRKVSDAAGWTKLRRPEVLALFADNQFGRTPKLRGQPKVEIVESGVLAQDGLAKRTQVRLVFGKGAEATTVRVVLYLPAKAQGPVPVLLHLGFSPNSLVFDEPGIEEGQGWDPKTRQPIPGRQAKLLPGFSAKPFLERGFAVAHVYYADIEPDFAGGAALGVRRLDGSGVEPRKPDEWGAIGAWSWGLSRIVDWLETVPGIDGKRIALSGASRLGKTSLWAAAQDQRFAVVMPLISGEGGAALSRRNFGETVANLTDPKRYFYWFAPRYASYAGDVSKLPVDSHMLLALIAPRPMLLVNGDTDMWSDWRGEELAADAARPVYQLFGKGDALQVVTHKGGHVVLPEDLTAMAGFMETHFSPAKAGKPTDAQIVAANAARKANPNRPIPWWPALSAKPASWFAGPEARTIADNILSWEDPKSGGWPLMNTTREPNRGDPAQPGPWGARAALIKATVNEMRFLARVHGAAPDPKLSTAVDRGLGFILDAQYPGGGFPHSWPTFRNPYDRLATFNDDEMTDLLVLLNEVATSAEFAFLPAERRKAAAEAYARGIDFILKTQIRAGGKLTAWAQQYDPETLEPRPARVFEPAAISGGESAGVLMLLMDIREPSPEMVAAIEAGVAWYKASQIDGIRVEATAQDRVVHADPSAPPVWARYYDISSNRPMFVGRDGIVRDRLADVEQERRAGYAWYGNWGDAVLQRHARWQAERGQRAN